MCSTFLVTSSPGASSDPNFKASDFKPMTVPPPSNHSTEAVLCSSSETFQLVHEQHCRLNKAEIYTPEQSTTFKEIERQLG